MAIGDLTLTNGVLTIEINGGTVGVGDYAKLTSPADSSGQLIVNLIQFQATGGIKTVVKLENGRSVYPGKLSTIS